MSTGEPRSAAYRMADRVLEGELNDLLRVLRGEAKSFDQIAVELDRRGVSVTSETVRRWCQRLEIERAS